MYTADIAALEQAVSTLQQILREGLLSADVWDRTTGLPLASHNSNPVAVALFNDIAGNIVSALGDSGFPPMKHAVMVDLEDDRMAVVLTFSDRLAGGVLLDKTTTNLGVVSAMAVPRLVEQVRAAESN